MGDQSGAGALLDRYEDRVPDLPLDMLGQVALPGRVLDQDHFSGADDPTLTVAGGYFHARVEIDDVLAAWRRVPVDVVLGLGFAKNDAVAGKRLDNLLPRLSSIHSTSMSRKCDWPLASV